jgi:hypothetical protein
MAASLEDVIQALVSLFVQPRVKTKFKVRIDTSC